MIESYDMAADKQNKYSEEKEVNEYYEKHRKNDMKEIFGRSESWQAIAKQFDKFEEKPDNQGHISNDIIFSGKMLQGGSFDGEKLENSDFSGSNMQECSLKNADLRNVNFTGADLSGADLSGANLDGAVFVGAKLIGTNFTGAHMHGVKFQNADLQDAILLDADLDNLSIEELQELVEYLALYYPYKLNLTRLNLTLLDLKRIDLTQVNLRGVDFTGCDFTGVNIFELDLSECIISPAQIEQAIGHVPTALELKKILEPKHKKQKSKMKGIDLDEFFSGGSSGFDLDTTRMSLDVNDLGAKGKDLFKSFKKQDSDDKIMEKFGKEKENSQNKSVESNVDDLRKTIEQHKREVLERRQEEQDREAKEKMREQIREKIKENKIMLMQNQSSRER